MFVPMVGLPLGSHRDGVMTSSQIADTMNKTLSSYRQASEFDLQLVPAYFPEGDISANDLPALYKLLRLLGGWERVFGNLHMTEPNSNTSNGVIASLDFIWSSISSANRPFGFSRGGRNVLSPFPGSERIRPVADCGGIPLWNNPSIEEVIGLERNFQGRWTGVRREQWRACVERGFAGSGRDGRMAGAVVFAGAEDKAESSLLAVRDGLVNVLMLGLPCADCMLTLLRRQGFLPDEPTDTG